MAEKEDRSISIVSGTNQVCSLGNEDVMECSGMSVGDALSKVLQNHPDTAEMLGDPSLLLEFYGETEDGTSEELPVHQTDPWERIINLMRDKAEAELAFAVRHEGGLNLEK